MNQMEELRELRAAAEDGVLSRITTALDAGANVNAFVYDMTILQWASSTGQVDACTLLIARGADVNARDGCGRSSLWFAAWIRSAEVCRVLLTNGFMFEQDDDNATSPLYVAIFNMDVPTIDVLASSLPFTSPVLNGAFHVWARRALELVLFLPTTPELRARLLGVSLALTRAGAKLWTSSMPTAMITYSFANPLDILWTAIAKGDLARDALGAENAAKCAFLRSLSDAVMEDHAWMRRGAIIAARTNSAENKCSGSSWRT